ncbi:MAG: MFS transporter [Planctomycetales bacterium]
MKHQLSESLASRTFIGLLLAQFTATFNDQAIHMVAVFYAVDMLVRFVQVPHIDEKAVVSIVTACFIAPFLLFSSFAGALGDRFSKRSVIVFWKVAEVGMMGLALAGLALPHAVAVDSPSLPTMATLSAALLIATVFLMGMHSTFFVPAKLGAMPEILEASLLSRGNGLLEGTSFTAQILGTSAGGILYALLKGEVSAGKYLPGREWIIGVLLLGLALVGTVTAALMRRIPAAAPDARLSWSWWRPLQANLTMLWRSKPLTLAVTGIAFCVFMTLFLRQTLLYQGELEKELEHARVLVAQSEGDFSEREPTGIDRWLGRVLPGRLARAAQEPELRVALLFALVGLGVGLGSLVAGFVSGHRVELGLVPLGAVVIVLSTLLPALIDRHPAVFVGSLFGIGFGAGFYLVPLYTLLQHRAPKESKGNVVSASNFVNVLGGIVSVGLFYLLTFTLDNLLGADLTEGSVLGQPDKLPRYVEELEGQMLIPRALFLAACLLACGAIVLLVRKMPDFFLRSLIWLKAWGHGALESSGIENMPLDGPVILVTNADSLPSALNLTAAVDRYLRVVLVEVQAPGNDQRLVRRMAQRAGMLTLTGGSTAAEWDRVGDIGAATLQGGGMMALPVAGPGEVAQVARLLERWQQVVAAPLIPVACRHLEASGKSKRHSEVHFGPALSPQTDLAAAQRTVQTLSVTSDHPAAQ